MKKTLGTAVNILGGAILLLVLIVVGYALLKPKPPQSPESVGNLAEAEAYLEDLVAYGTPPGISLAVVKDGTVVYRKGFGLADGPKGILATPDTVYKWMSTTKIFTAIAIMQLHEQNLLDIDDPVADYLPFFEVAYPADSDLPVVTIRHLLNHSSGLPDNFPEVIGWMHLEDEPSLNQKALLEEVLPDYNKLNFEPGNHSEYTNVGYMTLGAIIEAVSGQTYESYVVENICQPLGMTQSNFFYTAEMLPYAAVGSHPQISIENIMLRFLYDDLDAFIRENTDGKMWFNRFYADSNPPTGLIAPATDLTRFMLAYLNNGELDGTHILAPETIEIMTYESHLISVDNGQIDTPFHGLGWGIYPAEETADQRMYIFHDGGGPGFGSNMRIYPEESLGLVIVANDTTYNHSLILDLFASLDW